MKIWTICIIALWLSAFGAALTVDAATPKEYRQELIYRTTLGKAEDVRILLKKVGNPNLTDGMGYPLLYIAAARNDQQAMPVVKVLLEQGADVNFDAGMGHFPIIAAVQSGNIDIIELFFEKGASYRVEDGFGIPLVDYARQSGDPEIRRLIEDRVQEDIRQMVAGRTQSALDDMTYQLVYHTCAMQYFSYYYETDQDDIPKAEQQATLDKHKKLVSQAASRLAARFHVGSIELQELFAAGKEGIHAEMEDMISNRWRRKQGVGQPGDMEKRCRVHAAPYKEGYFNKAELDKRVRYK